MLDKEFRSFENHVLSLLKLIVISLWIYAAITIIPDFLERYFPNNPQAQTEQQMVRVIANSNTKSDQQIKNEVVSKLLDVNSPKLEQETIQSIMQQNYPTLRYEVRQGNNQLPAKWSDGKYYPQDYYESTVIKLGQGRGDNWFCALFSKACGVEEEEKEVKKRWKFKMFKSFNR